MTSLTELANVPKKVKIGNAEIEVRGVSGEDLIDLMQRFPDLGKVMAGVETDRAAFLKKAPEAVAAIIAIGTSNGGKPDEEKAARNLGLGVQVELLDAILAQTFPNGVGPFVAKLQEMGIIGKADSPQPEESTARPPSSPKPSSSSSQTDTPTP